MISQCADERWFQTFRATNESFEDEEGPGRDFEVYNEKSKVFFNYNP